MDAHPDPVETTTCDAGTSLVAAWLRHRAVLIVTHTFTTGPSNELRDYLLPRARSVGYVAHPFSYCDDTRSSYTLYEHGKEVYKKTTLAMRGPDPLFYMKDLVLTTLSMAIGRRQYDLAVGIDPLNTVAMLPWRRLGLAKRLIYYSIDYTPRRFANPLLNSIYHVFERSSCYGSDLVWNTSGRMVDARRANGVDLARSAPQMTVPTGNQYERMTRRPMADIDRHAVAFLGHLVPKGGIELLLQCFPQVIAAVPQAHLELIGGGPLLPELQRVARDTGIEDKVNFHGHVRDHREVEDILSRCALAAAPYVPDENSVSVYGGVNKPLVYLGAGLPVVMTAVPEIAHVIASAGAGVLVDYSAMSLAQGIIQLLSDDDLFSRARDAATAMAAQYSWRSIFDQAFVDTLARLSLQ